MSHAELLREASLQLLDTGVTHPRFWAPFVVVGEPAKPRAATAPKR